MCTYVAPARVTLSRDAHVVCHVAASVRVLAAVCRASHLFLEKSVRDFKAVNRDRIGGKPERMS